jgi:hypothetical protein
MNMNNTAAMLDIDDTERQKVLVEEWRPGEWDTTTKEVRRVIALRKEDRWEEVGPVLKEAVV